VSDFVKNKVVFEGQVIRSEWLGERDRGELRSSDAETTFDLINPYKDVMTDEIKVRHNTDSAACGMFYNMGSERLVITLKSDENLLHTNSCTSNAVSEITLLNYFEKGEDIYIPSWDECSEEQIANPNDPKNCYYLSAEAAQKRHDAWFARWYERRATFEDTNKTKK